MGTEVKKEKRWSEEKEQEERSQRNEVDIGGRRQTDRSQCDKASINPSYRQHRDTTPIHTYL